MGWECGQRGTGSSAGSSTSHSGICCVLVPQASAPQPLSGSAWLGPRTRRRLAMRTRGAALCFAEQWHRLRFGHSRDAIF